MKAININTKKAIEFLWFNYPLSLDFTVKPMISFIKRSRKMDAKLIDTNLIDTDKLVSELKKRFYV